jgi:hypothetical protein
MQKMLKLILRLFVLLCLAAPIAGQSAGQSDEWKRYKNVDGNFSVLFPVEPTDTVNGAEGGAQSHTILALQTPVGYMVVYAAIPGELPVDDATFEEYKDGVFKALPDCKVVTAAEGAPALRGYIGHWYRLSCKMENTEMTIIGNLYWGKHHSYAVMATYPTASEPTTVKKFTDSFSVIDASK